MRIIGGIFRGMHIDAPEGRDTRPTVDRVRESIVSMIISARGGEVEGDRVLDAFGGSGSMGLELLSRGASQVTCFEKERRAAATIRKNCASLKVPAAAYRLEMRDVLAAAEKGAGFAPGFVPFDVVVLDPPYKMDVKLVQGLVQGLVRHDLIGEDCVVVYERDKKAPGLALEGFELVKEKSYGSTGVDVLRYEGADATADGRDAQP